MNEEQTRPEKDYQDPPLQTNGDFEYGILSAESEVELCELVNKKIREGWEVWAGVSVTCYESQGFPRFRYSQTIVRIYG